MMMTRRLNVKLDEGLHEAVKEIARLANVSLGDYTRAALRGDVIRDMEKLSERPRKRIEKILQGE